MSNRRSAGGSGPLLRSFLLSDLALKSYDSKTFRSRTGESTSSELWSTMHVCCYGLHALCNHNVITRSIFFGLESRYNLFALRIN